MSSVLALEDVTCKRNVRTHDAESDGNAEMGKVPERRVRFVVPAEGNSSGQNRPLTTAYLH
jgi:hypothetical protein